MQQNLLRETSAYQFGVRPAVIPRDLSHVPLKFVTQSVKGLLKCDNIYTLCGNNYRHEVDTALMAEGPMGNPERDAIVFYMMNHVVSIIRQGLHPYEPIGPNLHLVEEYHRQLGPRSTRMFFYLLLICTRESRHEKGGSQMAGLYDKYGPEIAAFHQSCLGVSEHAAVEKLKSSPPDTTIGKYTSFLTDQFFKGSYNGGYGGKAWGKVAEVLRDFVHGKITAEMMLDTSFTLCHNNGPIFNKGMLYENYGSEIYKILDVQRSGQIPQLIGNGETQFAKDTTIWALYKMSRDALGAPMVGHVDWYKVEALGALKSYTGEKAQQAKKYGAPEGATEPAAKPSLGKSITGKFYQDQAVKATDPTQLEILPGVYVPFCKVRPS